VTDLIEDLPAVLETALANMLSPNEQVLLKLKGAFKEGLVCTDSRVIILKSGFMTGQTFGSDAFQLHYSAITGVQVTYRIMSGYFELSAGGSQNTPKNYWSNDRRDDPAKSPNCVSLNNNAMRDRFREASNFILSRVHELQHPTAAPVAAATPENATLDALTKLGELHKAGVLTDDEFAAKKADLLSRL
jgi:hypothetical protein